MFLRFSEMSSSRWKRHLVLFFLLGFFQHVAGQYFSGSIRWCTTNTQEFHKCVRFNDTVTDADNRVLFGFDSFFITCIQGDGVGECIKMVDQGGADVCTLDPGHMFIGGRYHNLVPILQEEYSGADRDHYYAVAVVKRSSSLRQLSDIRGAHACFPRVGDLAGWVLPITQLIARGIMKVADCNNHVRSVSDFFGTSCAAGSLSSLYNPLGDNSNSLCELCGSRGVAQQWCTERDIYSGHHGAVRCLLEAGDVAFTQHSFIAQLTSTWKLNGSASVWPSAANATDFGDPNAVSNSTYTGSIDESQFELLCINGGRAPLSQYSTCNWGRVPSHVVVTSSTKSETERSKLQDYITSAASVFGNRRGRTFSLFKSYQYGTIPNLMFHDETASLKRIAPSDQLYLEYLGSSVTPILALHSCPVSHVRMCVASLAEYKKCTRMREAFRAQLLKPELLCLFRDSHLDCMREIYANYADITMLDAGDVYTAGRYFGLIPIMNEVYNKDETFYYSVAVVKQLDLQTDLLYLKNKMTCHTGVMHGAGWVVPMAYLISNERIRGYGCNSLKAAAQSFTKSCAPGALDVNYNDGSEWYNMCQLCHGSSNHYCSRNAQEDYYGHTGAFRCLVEGGGDVAFVKHTTVHENTGGERRQFWARNQLATDYQLLCRDGTRSSVDNYAQCNIGMVRTNALVTRGGHLKNDTLIHTIVNLFMHGQQHFGQKFDNQFSFQMFSSDEPYADLIFSDATQQLLPLSAVQHNHREYLGERFLQARSVVDCHAAANHCVLCVTMATLTLCTLLLHVLV